MPEKKRKSKKDPRLARAGVAGFNKPKALLPLASLKLENLLNRRPDENLSKQGMGKISRRARCQRLTGQIKRNGRAS